MSQKNANAAPEFRWGGKPIRGYPNGAPDGISVLAKAKWRKWNGEWSLFVSATWRVQPGMRVEVTRKNGNVAPIMVDEHLGNTGPGAGDMDVFLPRKRGSGP